MKKKRRNFWGLTDQEMTNARRTRLTCDCKGEMKYDGHIDDRAAYWCPKCFRVKSIPFSTFKKT